MSESGPRRVPPPTERPSGGGSAAEGEQDLVLFETLFTSAAAAGLKEEEEEEEEKQEEARAEGRCKQEDDAEMDYAGESGAVDEEPDDASERADTDFGGAASPTGRSGQSGPTRCAICLMDESDLDLGDPNPTNGNMTPFKHFGKQPRQATMCDHCASTQRYLSSEGSVRSVSVALASYGADPKNKAIFLEKLACVLAMKSAPDEATSRVTKVSVDKYLAFLQRHNAILGKLRERQDAEDPRGRFSTTALPNAIGLQEYVQDFGNPLSNGDQVCTILMNGVVDLAVKTAREVPVGRHALKGIVEQAAGAFSDPMLDELSSLSVDDLSQSNFLRCLVAEFVNHRQLQTQLRAKLGRRRLRQAPTTGDNKSQGRSACSSTTYTGHGHTAKDIGVGASTPKLKRCLSPPGSAASSSPPSTIRREWVRRDPDGPAELVIHPPKRKVAAREAAEEESKAAASASSDGGAGVPSQALAGGTVVDMSFEDDEGSSQPVEVNVSSDLPKPAAVMRKRLVEFLRLFTQSNWTSHVRGKERAVVNLKAAIPGAADKCRQLHREDVAEEVMGWLCVTDAAQELISECKRTSKFEKASATKVWRHIARISSFFDGCNRIRSNPTEPPLVLEPNLRVLKAAGQYLHLVNAGDYAQAAGILDFAGLSPLFQKVGVAPNTTDQTCACWMADLTMLPVTIYLRQELGSLDVAQAYINALLPLVKAPFDITPKLREVVANMEALRTVFEVSSQKAEQPPKPSGIRQALDILDALDSKCKLMLGLKHGPLGRHLYTNASQIVARSAKDSVGRDMFNTARRALAEVLANGLSSKGKTHIVDITASLTMLTASALEELSENITDVFRIIGTIVEFSVDKLYGVFGVELFEALDSGIVQAATRDGGAGALQVKHEDQALDDARECRRYIRATFSEDFVAKLRPIVCAGLQTLKSDGNMTLEFLQASEKMHDKLKTVCLAAGVQAETFDIERMSSKTLEGKLMLLDNFLVTLKSFVAFGPMCDGVEFRTALLNALSHKGNDDGVIKKDRTAESVDDADGPLLHIIWTGAKSAAYLKGVLPKLPRDFFGDTECSATLRNMLASLQGTSMLDMFSQACADFVEDALVEVEAASMFSNIMPQDNDSIKMMGNSDFECIVDSLLSSVGQVPPQQVVHNLKRTARELLASAGDGVTAASDWPHHKPINLARRCLDYLSADDRKLIHLAPWLSDNVTALVSRKEANTLLDILNHVNDVAYLMVAASCVCSPMEEVNMNILVQAKQVQTLRSAMKDFVPLIQKARASMSTLPLRRSWAMLSQWTDNLAVLAETVMLNLLSSHSEALLKTAQNCDAGCPRWGSFISDHDMSMDMARLQLVENKTLASLPAKARQCADQMSTLKALGVVAGVCIETHSVTRDVVRISQNSFDFARRTMNVAAATRALFDSPQAAARSLPVVMRFKPQLPSALVAKLEALQASLRDDGGDEPPNKRARASAPREPASDRKGR